MPRLRPAPSEEKPKPQLEALPEEPAIEAAEVEPQVEVTEPEPPKQDDATVALQRQIDELKKSEALQKEMLAQANKDREEALNRTRELDTRYLQAQKEAQDSQYENISSAIAQAKAEAEKAQSDFDTAESLGDSKAKTDAVRRIARAESRIDRMEEGKEILDQQRKQPQRQPEGDPIDGWNLPKISSDWIKERRHLVNDNDKLNELRWYMTLARRAGLTEHTRPFLDFLEEKLGERPPKEPVVEEEKPKERSIVSAPVSRDVPSTDGKPRGKVRLTAQEVEAARVSGITPEEYATQKLKYAEMKANGQYGEQR
jgi:hypothetical protein